MSTKYFSYLFTDLDNKVLKLDKYTLYGSNNTNIKLSTLKVDTLKAYS